MRPLQHRGGFRRRCIVATPASDAAVAELRALVKEQSGKYVSGSGVIRAAVDHLREQAAIHPEYVAAMILAVERALI